MNKPHSIKQNPISDALPNFRNLGIVLKILLLGNLLILFYALLQAHDWGNVLPMLTQISPLFTPILLSTLLMLWLIQPQLDELNYRQGVLFVNGLVVILTVLIYLIGGDLYHPQGSDSNLFDVTRYVILSLVLCNTLLIYFRLRAQVLSHALHDARLQVLRARIRPHFLFNTLNTVLAIVRTQPKQAETALEDMADLFRMAMIETPDLVPIGQEIKLAKQYLSLESLRLSHRLHIHWENNDLPDNILIPPLLLQPLLENAVYHGIEPIIEGGKIDILMQRKGKVFQIKIENSCPHQTSFAHTGNQMALKNIRERLKLLFDVEAHYEVEHTASFYRVTITLPFLLAAMT